MPIVRLRQDSIRSIPYTGSDNAQCIYWDNGLACFGVRVYPNGRRSYVCAYRVNGRKRIVTLGRADVLTLDRARKKARIYLGQAADGEDPHAAEDALHASGTVKTLAEIYVERHAKAKKRSWRNDDSYMRRYVIPKLGSRLAGSITTADIARIHSEIGENHPYTANRVIEVVRKMYNAARTWHLIPREMQNPAVGIERFAEAKRRRYVTPAEMPNLAKAIDAEQNEFARHAIWLLLLTGLRRNEVLNAKWSDVDLKQRTFFIGQTKNGEALLTPLSRAAVARLKNIARIDGNPYIICGSVLGRPLVNLRSAWKRVRDAAGLQDVRIHDLRRTVGSWLVRDGASLHLVGAVLNHSDQKTTAGYAYFQTQDRQQALDRHGRNVTKLAKGRLTNQGKRGTQAAGSSAGAPSRPTLHSFSRQKLHKLVWSEPVATVAERIGISDVALSKACRRAGVPVPPRGHWAKVKTGKPTLKAELPLRPATAEDSIKIRVRSPSARVTLSSGAPVDG